MTAQLSEPQRALLWIVYDAFASRDEWPFYQYVATVVRRQLRTDPGELYRSLPPGLILPALDTSLGGQLRPENRISLTIRGLVACNGAEGDLELFVAAIAFIGAQAEEWEPDPAELRPIEVNSEEVAAALGRSGADRSVRRAYELLTAAAPEIWTSAGSSPDGTWHIVIDPEQAVRYAGVSSVQEFLGRRIEWEQAELPKYGEAPVPSRTVGVGAPMQSAIVGVTSGGDSEPPGRVFVSHASEDEELATALIECLRLGTGLTAEHFFYTSRAGTGVPPGSDFIEHIREQMLGTPLVIQIITPSYFQSPFCMAELGAQWILGRDCFPLIVAPMTYEELEGVLGKVQAGRIDEEADLDVLYDRLRKVFAVDPPTAEWGVQRRRFLERF